MQYCSGHNRSLLSLKPAVLAVALGYAAQAGAVEGGAITNGNGNIATQGRNTVVSQNSDRMVVDWKNFDIARNQSVEFRQPGTQSAVLNRVTTANPTQILGTLKANGQVFVVNPYGVTFGRSAKVDVGSLVASALNTSSSEFMAGGRVYKGNTCCGTSNLPRYVVLEGGHDGVVRNEGQITAREGVVLTGATVSNQGTIRARDVALQAGDGVAVRIGGSDFQVAPTRGHLNALAENGGLIAATGGDITLSAAATGALLGDAVRNTGRLEATRANIVGGRIELTAPVEGSIAMGGKISGDQVVANTSPLAYAESASVPQLEYPSTISNSGHDIRVQSGARVASKAAVSLSTENDIAVDGRVDGDSVYLWGDNVRTRAPIRAGSNVNIRARGSFVQDETSSPKRRMCFWKHMTSGKVVAR